ncbi:hypothetical protein EJ05DRAFT_497780 [Pseudovirgaria hyperparasitica]|uniref:Uncharacterized protein n=1 Tax=Pseudovirgaria hyperparasitica TaxID=470096 RepID=A0A6A6WGX3_9PEZI|nr:uncharacterized protein EJ05DRAFT_497780 [Pseudovirgaria hyperparasitica]KAF2761226.1 hypothetical protein EJ05DRAFT_497780 [Pseudovirgaria hyperparasitica]
MPFARLERIFHWLRTPKTKTNAAQLPDDVRTILQKRRHRPAKTQGVSPLASLYRMYEYIVLDYNIGLRSEIEWFYNHSDWAVSAIPDPKDSNAERYAILAVLPRYLAYAFNNLAERGLPRDAPSIITNEELDELQKQPKVLEKLPSWLDSVPKLDILLDIPDSEGQSADEATRSEWFFEKNINVHEPHVLFV